jgi:aspartyl protease family protein
MNSADRPQPRHPLGRLFVWLSWLLLLGLLTWQFEQWLSDRRNPNRALAYSGHGNHEVVLQRNRNGQYIALGRINGEVVELLLDTGASDVSIPQSVADRLQLERGQPRRYQTANGMITAWATQLDEVALGDLRLYNVNASINPHMAGETILLGMSFLRRLEFHQRGDSLTLRPHS